ncbi:M16 family metallopeptidase [Formosa haliotis]|uniref:M16 family metallopeptidase n=1 Tax=Formosa haliotis TaxID=1555194 RepID=UPI0008270DA3|nr:M16 family metallopeptidase [Formosa haliotis]
MKHILIVFSTLFIVLSSYGQERIWQDEDLMPTDKTITKGVLPNGLTYYIKSTNVVKDVASYYIIQNVGSILENEDQSGLAHFLEHMAFNGTESFPGKGILNTLQKHGAVFGKDINAYTSFDETVYNLNNIPTKEGLVDTCLTVLHDWSNYLLLTDAEIDAERGVIKEEWRTGQNGAKRILDKTLQTTYNNSKYAARMPIGLMSVVEEFDYKALRDFYHDWYRTDLQAIAVIGDFDIVEMEQKIIEKFSNIPAVENPKERYIITIPETKALGFSLATDPEVSSASIRLGIRQEKTQEPETVSHFRTSLIRSMVTSMLSSRIIEQAQHPDASFLSARVGFASLTRTTNYFYVALSPKPNLQKEAFNEVLTEVQRGVTFGFTQSELDRAIVRYHTSYKNRLAKKDEVSHKQIENVMQNNYLSKASMRDLEQEYDIAQQILSHLTIKDLHDGLKQMYIEENRFINVTGVQGQDNLNKEQAQAIIKDVESNQTITPYVENLGDASLLSGVQINPGTITTVKQDQAISATTFLLSNGVKVHYKFVDKQKDKVSMQALSYGGTSLLPDSDLPSASMVGSLVQMSGLGDFSAVDLKKVLTGKSAKVSIGLGEISESLSGESTTTDVETMLQLVNLHFVKPRFDADAFNVLKSNIDSYLIRKSKNVSNQMKDSLLVTVFGEQHPIKRIFNQDYANEIDFEKIKRIYKERFSDVSDFEFFIVGDVQEAQLKPLLETYIASIPSKNTQEEYKDTGVDWVSNQIKKQIFIDMEAPKANVNIVYKKELPYSRNNVIYTNVLGDILQLRVTETVREAEGGAYSPSARASFERQPQSQAIVSFSFDCNPDMADHLVAIVNGELEKIAQGIINKDDLEKIRINFLKEHEQAKNKNGFDMQLLTRYYRFDENLNDPKYFTTIVKKMSKTDIQNMAKHILNGGQSYQVVFKPIL